MRRASTPLHAVSMLLAGALAILSFAPFSWPVFSLISVIAAYLLLNCAQAKSAFVLGWAYGTGFFGAGVSWVYVSIHYHGGMGILSASLMTALFCIALGLLFALQFQLYRRLFRYPSAVGFAALWIGFEWLRSWFLTGFPWLYLGYGWLDTPLAALAPIGGVWLVSSAALILALLLAYTLKHRKLTALVLAVMLFGASHLMVPKEISRAGQPIKVALVQPDIEQSLKWQQSHFEAHLEQLGRLSRTAPEADWIVWPETAIPRLINTSFELLGPWIEEFSQRDQILISGFPRREWNEESERWIYLNSIGTLTGTPSIYDKQRLVPFGEYIPLENWLRGAIEFFNLPMSSFSLPSKPSQGLRIGEQQVAALICYEIAYPELVRDEIKKGAGVILTLSNDTWFEGSHAPAQHLQIARMRALENHRWLIRATNNGHTAIIDPLGRVTAKLPTSVPEVLLSEVWLSDQPTPYQRFGAYPTLLTWMALFGIGLIYSRRQRTLKH